MMRNGRRPVFATWTAAVAPAAGFPTAKEDETPSDDAAKKFPCGRSRCKKDTESFDPLNKDV